MPDELEKHLLPGVSQHYVRERLDRAKGDEIESGKFMSPDSSSALAVNAFAWFHQRPALLPRVAQDLEFSWAPTRVEVEHCARFPWSGGLHPWLDAYVETDTHLLGIESKRHEPFRDSKEAHFSDAYDRPVWGDHMKPYEAMKDELRKKPQKFKFLDGAQLVKHAFGLVTESKRRDERKPFLVYLYAEPERWPNTKIENHRKEVHEFASATKGSAVGFVSVRWRDWVDTWADAQDEGIREHGKLLIERFDLTPAER